MLASGAEVEALKQQPGARELLQQCQAFLLCAWTTAMWYSGTCGGIPVACVLLPNHSAQNEVFLWFYLAAGFF